MSKNVWSKVFVSCLVMFLAAACGPEPSKKGEGTGQSGGSSAPAGSGGGSGSSGTSSSSGSPSSSGSGGSSGASCSAGEDCPYWYCDCNDSSVVNARTCDNNSCAPANTACPSACEAFGTTWSGYTVDLQNNGGGSGSGGSGSGSGGSGSGGSGSGGGGAVCSGVDSTLIDGSACYACSEVECCYDLQACSGSLDCVEWFDCIADGYSNADCSDFYPGAVPYLEDLGGCLQTWCADECL